MKCLRGFASLLFGFLVAHQLFADAPVTSKRSSAEKSREAQIARWVAELGADRFQLREDAFRSLIQVGAPALDQLEMATKSRDREASQRAIQAIQEIENVAVANLEKVGVKVNRRPDGTPIAVQAEELPRSIDDALANLAALREVRTLSIRGHRSKRDTWLTDVGFTHVSHLTRLTSLQVDCGRITDAGLEAIASLRELEDLTLDNTRICGDGFIHLVNLSRLETLICVRSPVVSRGVKRLADALAQHGKIRQLALGGSEVSDESMVEVARLSGLTYLHLHETRIGDNGVAEIVRLSHLTSLQLTHTRTSEASIPLLASHGRLEFLAVSTSSKMPCSSLAGLAKSKSLRVIHVIGIDGMHPDAVRLQASIPQARVVAMLD